jgi:hypothetical protein
VLTTYVMLTPAGYMRTHQRFEQFTVIRHAQVEKLMRDDEILESGRLIREITSQGDDAIG